LKGGLGVRKGGSLIRRRMLGSRKNSPIGLILRVKRDGLFKKKKRKGLAKSWEPFMRGKVLDARGKLTDAKGRAGVWSSNAFEGR